MNNDIKYTIINSWVWSPLESNLFKTTSKDTAEHTTYHCSIPDTCPLLKVGQCINRIGLFGPKCTYGYVRKEIGPTKKSKKCSSWVAEKRKECKDVVNLVKGSPPKKMVKLGEHVYLPYAHMNMNQYVPFLSHSHIFTSGSPFIPSEKFTLEVVFSIVKFMPYSLMGGEITSYQKEEVPKFINDLQEVFPALYTEFVEKYPRYALEVKNNVGRVALLNTVLPGDYHINDKLWKWDGKKLTSTDEKLLLFANIYDRNRINAINSVEVTVYPKEGAVVKIENNNQVGNNTVFVD